jgi:hypothetical protein
MRVRLQSSMRDDAEERDDCSSVSSDSAALVEKKEWWCLERAKLRMVVAFVKQYANGINEIIMATKILVAAIDRLAMMSSIC